MNLLRMGIYYICYQRQGNDKNGNPIYLINVFECENDRFYNCNFKQSRKSDKNGNIRIQSYNIGDTITRLLDEIKGH